MAQALLCSVAMQPYQDLSRAMPVRRIIACASCGASIPAANVNLDKLVAKCGGCNSVFDISQQVTSPGPIVPQRRRAPVAMPAAITLQEAEPANDVGAYRAEAAAPRTFTLVRRWFGARYVVQLLFALAWDAFLVVWYSQATRSGDITALLFPIAHLAVGLALTYGAIAGLFNRTVITATKDQLSIRHGPLPWPGNRDIPTAALKQLFCEEVVTRSKNGPSATYHLAAMLDDGKKVRLLRSLPEPDQALYLEQALESRLGIVDVEMEGEYLRR